MAGLAVAVVLGGTAGAAPTISHFVARKLRHEPAATPVPALRATAARAPAPSKSWPGQALADPKTAATPPPAERDGVSPSGEAGPTPGPQDMRGQLEKRQARRANHTVKHATHRGRNPTHKGESLHKSPKTARKSHWMPLQPRQYPAPLVRALLREIG